MKRILFVFFLAMGLHFASAQSTAEIEKKKKVEDAIGFSLGSTYSSFTGDEAEYFEYLFGLEIDAFVMMQIAPELLFIPGLDFSMAGAQYEDVDDLVIRLSYIYFSTLFRYQNEGGFFAEAGPRLGLLVAAKQKYQDESEDIKDDFKSVDVGAAVGLGMEFQKKFGIGVRWVPGFMNILEDDESKLRNTGFVLRAYVRL